MLGASIHALQINIASNIPKSLLGMIFPALDLSILLLSIYFFPLIDGY